MKKLILGILLITMTITLTGCGSTRENFVQVIPSKIESMDPTEVTGKYSWELFADIYMGINRITPDGNVELYGAKSIDVSEDGLTYTINLRDDVKWVNNLGEEVSDVKAQDYVNGYQRMLDPKVGALYSYLFEDIKNAKEVETGEKSIEELGVKVIDDYTFEITLESPTPYFESMMGFQAFVAQPKEAIEKYGDDYGKTPETTWFSGPYYVTSYDPDYIVSLTKNPLYINADNVEVQQVDYRLNTDATSAYNSFINGETDFVEIENSTDYDQVKEEGIVTDLPLAYSYYGVLSTADTSATSNENLRKALLYGFDRETILDSVSGDLHTPIEYIIPSGITPVAYEGQEYRDIAGDSLVTYDKEKADEYFDKYMKDMGLSSREEISIDILVSSDTVDGEQIGEVIQSFYKQEFGIGVNVDAEPNQQYKILRTEGSFDMLITSWAPDYADPSTYLALWQSLNVGGLNYAVYQSEEYDKLYNEANNELDVQKRFEDFAKVEQKLVDDAIIIPFYQKNNPYLITKGYEWPQHPFSLISHEFLVRTDED